MYEPRLETRATTLAGTPTRILSSGASAVTSEFAAMITFLPIRIGPEIFAPGLMKMSYTITG